MPRTAHRTPTRNHPRKRLYTASSSTEDSRLHTVVDDRHHSYYAYDHAGGSCGSRAQSQACLSYAEMQQRRRSQRTLKVTGHSHQLDVNADLMHTVTSLRQFTVYPSPYVVLSNHGYTKHYYAGTERLAARQGGGFGRTILGESTEFEAATRLFDQALHQAPQLATPPEPHLLQEEHPDDVYKFMMKDIEIPENLDVHADIEMDEFLQAMQNLAAADPEPDVYFYHSDHLGSASWITDGDGIPVQHLQYLPYGEPYINQRVSGYSERFTFTGKERDEETGYGYFGARYMDHELMTMWLSVDPLSDKYPSISPYNYCMWNPVKLVDPDGNEVVASDDWYKNKETGAVFWREGHAKSITLNGDTYDNIGESYSYLMADGQHVNYFQNCPLTIGQERDVTPLAYEDQSCRTSLIRTRSVLPDSHKKDLFNSHVASRGIYPYHSAEGGYGLGIDATFCGIVGINVHGGIYRDNGGGWGLYGGVNYCTGMEVGLSVVGTRVSVGQGFSGENQIVGGGLIVSGSYNVMSNSGSAAFSPSKLGFDAGLSTKIGWTWSTPAIRLF